VFQINLRKSRPKTDRGVAPAITVFTGMNSVSQAVDWNGFDWTKTFHHWVFSLAALSQPFCGVRRISIPPPSYTPWLHDHYSLRSYYGCSDPGGSVSRHPPWFPDSRRHDFIPCHLQTSVPVRQPRSTPSALPALFCSDFVLTPQTHHRHRPKRVHSAVVTSSALLRPGTSLPVALHPGVSPRCSYFQILALQCRPGRELSSRYHGALSGAR
jgi:hypothetical protein